MSAISVILLVIVFCLIQIAFLKKGNKKWVKYLPTVIGSIGVVVALLGIVMKKFLGKKQFLYFIPFILFVIVYIGAMIMGLGMISVKEIVWLALFLIGGFLLSKEKIWGCLLGMIPGIVFVGLSTNDTGQVINIEFPLGMIIIGFYVGCGIGMYRKQYLQKKKR